MSEQPVDAPINSSSARVPWDVHVRAWQVYAALGHGDQSARRIAARGGFGWYELACLLAERDPFSASQGWRELDERQRGKLDRLRAAGAEE